MRVGISINGQGRGHLTRMTAVGQILAKEHELIFWCPHRYHDSLRSSFPKSLLFDIPYYKFVFSEDKIDYIKTGVSNVENLVGSFTLNRDLADQLRLTAPDVLISDFEPFLPRAAKKAGIPVIQLNHPAVVLKSPVFTPEALLSKIAALSMMGEYDVKLISSFYDGDIGPIIRPEIRDAVVSRGDHFLVYVSPSMRDSTIAEMKRSGIHNFRLFPDPKDDFVEALTSCKGIITNAGHQLLSEALHLKKPVLSIPFEGQFEQRLNAEMLKKSGRGIAGTSSTLRDDLHRFRRFLEETPAVHNPAAGEENFTRFCLGDDSENAVALLNRHIYRFRVDSPVYNLSL
ncbi:MAG: glycosyltransferase family protein [Sediminispirochaetaceae bacterium]